MSISAAQNQREIDHDADVELVMERIEQEMREELMAGAYYALAHRNGWRVRETVYGQDDVINAMVDLDEAGMNDAIFLSQTDPIAAAEQLGTLMERAVEQVIGLAPIREAAEFEEREQAA